MANQQTAEFADLGAGYLDNSLAFVAPELMHIFVARESVGASIGHHEIDASLLEPRAQRVGVVCAILNHTSRLLSWTAFGSWDANFTKRGFRKTNFCRRCKFKPNSQRRALTNNQYHPFRALATLGLAEGRIRFFAAVNLRSGKRSSDFNRLSSSSAPGSARHASHQMWSSFHCFNRRQRMAQEGYLSGRKRDAVPVCRIRRMASKQARFNGQGRPLLSLRGSDSDSNVFLNSHSSSVNNSCSRANPPRPTITAMRRIYL